MSLTYCIIVFHALLRKVIQLSLSFKGGNSGNKGNIDLCYFPFSQFIQFICVYFLFQANALMGIMTHFVF